MKVTYQNFIMILLYVLASIALLLGVVGVQYPLPFLSIAPLFKYILALVVLLIIIFMANFINHITINRKSLIIITLFMMQIILISVHIVFSNGIDQNVKFIFTLLASSLVYVMFQQRIISNIYPLLINFYKCIFYVLCFLTIITFLRLFSSMGSYWGLKDMLQLPIGGSNFIECWILMFAIFLSLISKKTTEFIKIFLIGIIGMLCTRTKIGILSWGAFFIILLFYKRKMFFKIDLRFLLSLLFIFAIGMYLLQWSSQNNFFDYTFKTIQLLFSNDQTDVDRAFNGRLDLFEAGWNSFLNNPIIGSGMGYTEQIGGHTHNYVLEILASMGTIGGIMTFIQYAIIFHQLIIFRKNSIVAQATLFVFLFVFANSMYEPCIDEMFFNIFFWMILSLGTNNYLKIKNRG